MDNAEGLYWVTFEIGSMGYLRRVDGVLAAEQQRASGWHGGARQGWKVLMVGRCNESRWQVGIELAATGLLLCRKEGQN